MKLKLILAFGLLLAITNSSYAYRAIEEDFTAGFDSSLWTISSNSYQVGADITPVNGWTRIDNVSSTSSSNRGYLYCNTAPINATGDFNVSMNFQHYNYQSHVSEISVLGDDGSRLMNYKVTDYSAYGNGTASFYTNTSSTSTITATSSTSANNKTVTLSRVGDLLTLNVNGTIKTSTSTATLNSIRFSLGGARGWNFGWVRYNYLYVDDFAHDETWGHINFAQTDLSESWDASDVDQLYGLYQSQSDAIEIDGKTWYYMEEDFSSQGRAIGDSWIDGQGYEYIVIGSGLTTNPDYFVSIPEPTTIMLLLSGLVCGILRKKKNS